MPNRYQTGAIVNLEFPDIVESFPNEVSLFTELNHDGQREKIILYTLLEGKFSIVGSVLQDVNKDGGLDLLVVEIDKVSEKQRVRCLENITKRN